MAARRHVLLRAIRVTCQWHWLKLACWHGPGCDLQQHDVHPHLSVLHVQPECQSR